MNDISPIDVANDAAAPDDDVAAPADDGAAAPLIHPLIELARRFRSIGSDSTRSGGADAGSVSTGNSSSEPDDTSPLLRRPMVVLPHL